MPKILFVDDEPAVLAGLRDALRREPFRIFTAHSADQALAMLEQESIDVIVSDERMPGICGAGLLARVCRTYPDTVTGGGTALRRRGSLGRRRVFTHLSPCRAGRDPQHRRAHTQQHIDQPHRDTTRQRPIVNQHQYRHGGYRPRSESHGGRAHHQRRPDALRRQTRRQK